MKVLKQAARVVRARLHIPRLVYAHYGVTHRCNMRCRMCVVWKSANRETELTPSQVQVLAENLHRAGTCTVALGGGEPFVREDLEELVFAFAKRDLEVRLLTNGIGIKEERIQAVVEAGVRHVSISLDTLDPAKEQEIYNGVDVWQDILSTMRRFRAWLPEDAVPVVNVCVSRLNLSELPDLVRFARDEGFSCSFVPISLSPSEEESDGFAAVAPDLAVADTDAEAARKAYDELLTMKRAGAPIANSSRFLRDSLEHLLHGTYPWQCDAGGLYVSVSPEGGISMCHNEEPFARWDSRDLAGELVRRRGEFAALRDACAGCMRPCWAEVTHAAHDVRAGLEAFRTLHLNRRGGKA